jgi:hypothetical protein
MNTPVGKLGLEGSHRPPEQRVVRGEEPERHGAGNQARVEPRITQSGAEPAVDERLDTDGLLDLGHGSTRLGPHVVAGPVPAHDRDEACSDCRERHAMPAEPLLPPVETGLPPEIRCVARADGSTRHERLDTSPVPLGMRAERPEPSAVSVELEERPPLVSFAPVEAQAAVELLFRRDLLPRPAAPDELRHPAGAAFDRACAPPEEGLRARDLPGSAQRVGDEGAVTKPAEGVGREAGCGDVCAARILILQDHLDAASCQRLYLPGHGRSRAGHGAPT